MGNQPPKAPKRMDLDDAIIEMKIQSKGIQRASKKAEKESEKYRKQAKEALKKNNEEGAKLYAISASQKHTEATNYQRTAIKMQLMCDQIKSMKNNEKMVQTFSNMTHLVSQQMGQMDTVKMAENMGMFNEKMDEIMINNKMMTEVMNQDDMGINNTDDMLNALKQEVAMEDQTKLIEGGQTYNQHNTNQQQMHQNQQKQESDANDPFLDQLKGL